jgi:hypothetical protein
MSDTTLKPMRLKEVRAFSRSCEPPALILSIQDIPNLDLSGRYTPSSNPGSSGIPSPTDADTSGPSSRRTSLSSVGRPSSASGRPGSGNSSRSTSFNLPNEARREIRADKREPGEEVELDEEMDEESQLLIFLCLRLFSLTGLS